VTRPGSSQLSLEQLELGVDVTGRLRLAQLLDHARPLALLMQPSELPQIVDQHGAARFGRYELGHGQAP
jgi:hypothetical protein